MEKEGHRYHIHAQGNIEEMYSTGASMCGDIRRGISIHFGDNNGGFVVSMKDWFLIGFYSLFQALRWDIMNILYLTNDFSDITGWEKLYKKIKGLIK